MRDANAAKPKKAKEDRKAALDYGLETAEAKQPRDRSRSREKPQTDPARKFNWAFFKNLKHSSSL